MRRKSLLAVLFLIGVMPVFSQPYGRGAVLDPALYARVPQKAATRDTALLPESVSLKDYAPYPGDQGSYGTCTAWSTAYAARTIAESLGFQRKDRDLTTGNVFSPVFIYKNISDDPSCRSGTVVSDALELMKNQGAVKRLNIERTMEFRDVPLFHYTSARKYPIGDYARLFGLSRTWDSEKNEWGPIQEEETSVKVKAVKKALAEGKPVIIGMNCPNSFFDVQEQWMPREDPSVDYGGHAMCVVGYDDTKFGGAFEIQNSWGISWGKDGYGWIRYNDFGSFVVEAYEIIEDLTIYRDAIEFNGSVTIEMRDSEDTMAVEFVSDGYYKTKSAYAEGTQFRYLMSTEKPAYVYAFAADAHSYTQIFPSDGVLAVLDYRENAFAFPPEGPGEINWLELDEVSGTDYLVVLFSKQPLDIDEICRRFMNAKGNFAERVEQAAGADYIRPYAARYEKENIAYTAQSTNKAAIFGLLLAIEHK